MRDLTPNFWRKLLDELAWLHTIYMADFFIEQNYEKLPCAWRRYFDALLEAPSTATATARALDFSIHLLTPSNSTRLSSSSNGSLIAPLSLMAFKATISAHTLPAHRAAQTPADVASAFGLEVCAFNIFSIFNVSLFSRQQTTSAARLTSSSEGFFKRQSSKTRRNTK